MNEMLQALDIIIDDHLNFDTELIHLVLVEFLSRIWSL